MRRGFSLSCFWYQWEVRQGTLQTFIINTTWKSISRVSGLQRTSSIRHHSISSRNIASTKLALIECQLDRRNRLSQLWVPTGGIVASPNEDAHSKLLRAGFLRQAHPGVFHLLPLGRRVQAKLEALIDKYMCGLGASRLELSSISSEELWAKSGRLGTVGSELFRFKDRKEVPYILSPTHEEEITSLVSSTVKSYKQLPLRLYQISRKYRDELRPRHGLLRSREFVMKDLYTFDYNSSLALDTYHEVRKAYARLFNELKLPYLVAEADSGDMGGNLSHEFHFPTSKGEDYVVNCEKCDYVANEELAESPLSAHDKKKAAASRPDRDAEPEDVADMNLGLQVWRGVSRDRLTLVNVWFPSSDTSLAHLIDYDGSPEVNTRAVKAILPELDTSIDDPLIFWSSKFKDTPPSTVPRRLINLLDGRVSSEVATVLEAADSHLKIWPASTKPFPNIKSETMLRDPVTGDALNLLRIQAGDPCPRCSVGTLKVQKAIELGHTFHLGTRYSDPLLAKVAVPVGLVRDEQHGSADLERAATSSGSQLVTMQMGCHGIGVTRMIGAVAETLSDDKGLNWPRVMAPFEVVVVPGKDVEAGVLEVYDVLSLPQSSNRDTALDLVLDDRAESFPWKMQDADLVGYPIIVVVGRSWKAERACEVQCRRLKVREIVPVEQLLDFVHNLINKM